MTAIAALAPLVGTDVPTVCRWFEDQWRRDRPDLPFVPLWRQPRPVHRAVCDLLAGLFLARFGRAYAPN